MLILSQNSLISEYFNSLNLETTMVISSLSEIIIKHVRCVNACFALLLMLQSLLPLNKQRLPFYPCMSILVHCFIV
jgi:hypothetical protein